MKIIDVNMNCFSVILGIDEIIIKLTCAICLGMAHLSWMMVEGGYIILEIFHTWLLFTLLSILQYQKYSKPSIVKTSEISSQTYTASTDKIDGKWELTLFQAT